MTTYLPIANLCDAAEPLAEPPELWRLDTDAPRVINNGYANKYPNLYRAGAEDSIHLFAPVARGLPLPITLMERHPNSAQVFVPLGLGNASGDTPSWLAAVAEDAGDRPANIRALGLSDNIALRYPTGMWHCPLLSLASQSFLVIDKGEDAVTEEYILPEEETVWLVDGDRSLQVRSPRLANQPSEMDRDTFVGTFGTLVEHSPWVIEAVWQSGIDNDTIDHLHHKIATLILDADRAKQDDIIEKHPQLATERLEALASYSREEQTGAGLTGLTSAEKDEFAALNARYRDTFGFPFIIAVATQTKDSILRALQRRVDTRHRHLERTEALYQIFRIIHHRLSRFDHDTAGAH